MYFSNMPQEKKCDTFKTEEEISGILEKLWHSYFQCLSNNKPYIKDTTIFPSVSSITKIQERVTSSFEIA